MNSKLLNNLVAVLLIMSSLNALAQQEGRKIPFPREKMNVSRVSADANRAAVTCGTDTIVYPYLKELSMAAPNDSFFIDAMVGNVRTASQAYHLNSDLQILGVQFWGAAYSTSPAPQTLAVRAYLYSVDGQNFPVSVIDSADVVITEAYDFYEAMFSAPRLQNQNFAVAVRCIPSDTLAVITNNAGNVWSPNYGEGLSWRRFGSGTWNTSMSFFGQDLEYMIFPIVSYTIAPSFTASEDSICEGGNITFVNTSNSLLQNRMVNLNTFDQHWNLAMEDLTFSWDIDGNSTWVNAYDGNNSYNTAGKVRVRMAAELRGYYSVCADTIDLDITVNPQYNEAVSSSICPGDTLSFGTLILTSPGTYTEMFSSVAGCDSLVEMTVAYTTIDASVSVNNTTLTANASNADYQWIDCATNTILIGENSQSFTATSNGSYAVIITDNNCSDTSSCIAVQVTGINSKIKSAERISVYPNPASKIITINSKDKVPAQLVITNLLSEVVSRVHPTQFITTLNVEEWSRGIYFVNVLYPDGIQTVKLICE